MNMPHRSGSPPHVIETLQWACRFVDARSANRHQQRLSHFLKEHGARVIHDLFEKLSPPGEVWHIDHLELDLGRLRAESSQEQWAEQLHEQLWNELLRLRAESAPAPFAADAAVPAWLGGSEAPASAADTPRLASEHSLDHFLYYVEYGHLPWSAGALTGRNLGGWLEKLAHRDGSRLWTHLQQLPLAEQTLQRLSRISPHHGLQALLEARHSGLSAGLTQLDEQVLLPLQARGRLSAYQLQQLRQAWRVAGLRALWGNSSSVLSADRLRQLVLALTQSLNRMLGPGWRTLLKPAAQADDAQVPSDVAQQLLLGVLGSRIEDPSSAHRQSRKPHPVATATAAPDRPSHSHQRPPTPPLERTTRAALARLLTLLDGRPDTAGSGRALSLLRTLSQHCPRELRMHLQSWTRRRARRARWSSQVDASLLWPVLHCLSEPAQDSPHGPNASPEAPWNGHASWRESLRQFVLGSLSRAPSAGGTLSQWQARLIEYTLRHLALGNPLPRHHRGWQALWQSAWTELAGGETRAASAPDLADTAYEASSSSPLADDNAGSSTNSHDLSGQVRDWLLNPVISRPAPWWVELPGPASPAILAELTACLRLRAVRALAATKWPEYRRLQLLHLLMLSASAVSKSVAIPTDRGRMEPATSRLRWIADEIRQRIRQLGRGAHGASPNEASCPAGDSIAAIGLDCSALQDWLWLAAIEWAMQTPPARPHAASLNDYWLRGLRALNVPVENAPAAAKGGSDIGAAAPSREPIVGRRLEPLEPNDSPSASLLERAQGSSSPPVSIATVGHEGRKSDVPAALIDAAASTGAPSNPVAPPAGGRETSALTLQVLDELLDAPLRQWNAPLRLQVARLLQDDNTRAAWCSSQPFTRQSQLLQRQFPAAFPVLGECVELLLAASREQAPEMPAGTLERRLWRFLSLHLFGEGRRAEPGPLARRFALDLGRRLHRERHATEAPSAFDCLARLDQGLSSLVDAAAAPTPTRMSIAKAMRQALVPPLTSIETRELRRVDTRDIDDPPGYLAGPIDAGNLRRQLDRLLARPHRQWRPAHRRQLMALLDREETCAIWLSQHDESQRWALLDRHLADGASELRAATEQLVTATQALQPDGNLDELRSDCWWFLVQFLFVDALPAEPALLARRYAMSLRHRDLDADSARSVSFQRWKQRLADALPRASQHSDETFLPEPHNPPDANPPSADAIGPTPPAHPPGLGETMVNALRQPPSTSEQWEAGLTIEARQRLYGDRKPDRSGQPSAPETVIKPEPPASNSTGFIVKERAAIPQSARPGCGPLHRRALPGDERNPIYVANAGLVLLANYTQRLFGMLQLLDGTGFNDGAARWRAIHALDYLVHGHNDGTEPEWVLNKLLCGLPLQEPVPPCDGLDEGCHDVLDGLLRAVIAHWKAIGNTSIAGLRESFLQRRGRLVRRSGQDTDYWQLKVEQRPFDLLMDRLPWGFSTIKLPWMPGALHVDWR